VSGKTAWLIVLVAGVLSVLTAGEALARGGGGCLEEGTPVLTPAGPVPIERLVAGDTVLAPSGNRLDRAVVQAVVKVHPTAYVELVFDDHTVRVTPEHPLAVAPKAGVFRTAASARAGQEFWQWDGSALRPAALRSVRWVAADRPAYNLLVAPNGVYLAGGLLVHNKGCFLPDTPILRADGTETAIRDVRPGDRLMAYTPDGEVTATDVREVLSLEVDEYAVVTTASAALKVTLEHPFYVGGGEFRTLAALRPGDCIHVFTAQGLREEPILSILRVAERTRVYNLRTDEPHTYFAAGVAVHNKGGGCFAAGTPIRTPQGEVAIELLVPGDEVLAVDADGRTVTARVEMTYAARGRLLRLRTARGELRTTAEQPLRLADGRFVTAGEVVAGRYKLCAWDGGSLAAAGLVQYSADGDQEPPVFNLQVSGPHTFIAGGLVVHNKGGGGGGGGGGHGFSGGHGSGSGGQDGWTMFIVAGIAILVIILLRIFASWYQNREQMANLDYSFSAGRVKQKAAKTGQLLEFIAKQDPAFAPEALKETARKTFILLQQCWQARQYDPMKPLLMPDLYAEHLAQIQGMIRNHEIDKIEQLKVQFVDLVKVRYTHDPNQREFTALISAWAKDYYVDDRTDQFLRGDFDAQPFQEFWTFQLQDGQWRLREIEQTRESNALKERDFFEPMTDARVEDITKGVGGEGPAGPWTEADVTTKDTRIERMLGFLVQTDKLWDREAMRERARQVFLKVLLARESGDPEQIPADDLFPEAAAHLRGEIVLRRDQGLAVSFRNLCVRKVDLVLVRNFTDNSKDEFTARIRAHAQVVCAAGDPQFSDQPDVMPFEQYWTFGRLDNQWKLKEVEPPAKGREQVRQENLDEDSTPAQVQWYYKHARPT
jgi:hypothetical protein